MEVDADAASKLALQNKILAEALRVLRPGGVLTGSDSLASNDLHHFHEGDTCNPIDTVVSVNRRLYYRADGRLVA